MRIYNLLFYKSYQLSKRSGNFDDVPVLGGITFVVACLMFNIFTFFMLLDGLGIGNSVTFNKKYKYVFSLLLVVSLFGYYLYNNRYKKILERLEKKESDFIKGLHPIIVIAVYYILSFGLLLLAGLYKNHDWIFKNN
jgi:hypothetical protein